MYRCQLNFAIICATSALGISWQHLNHPNLLVRSVYRFDGYFHVRLILHDLDISLQHEYGSSKVKKSYIKSAYCSICDDYGVNTDKIWIHGNWFYTTDYRIFGHEVKATGRSLSDNLTQWIIKQSRGFSKKRIENISRSVRVYVYLLLTSQVQARSSIIGNSARAVDAQQVFKSTFKTLINEDYSIGIYIERYQGVLEHALSKVGFSVGTGICMLPSDLNLSMRKAKGYNNKILVSNTDMKIGSNRDINKHYKKLPVTPSDDDAPKIVILVVQHGNPKMITDENDC